MKSFMAILGTIFLPIILFHLIMTRGDIGNKATIEDSQNQLLVSKALVKDLNAQLDTFGELADIFPENRAIVLAIDMTESACNPKVIHPDKDTKGRGGIKKSIWDKKIKAPLNSLLAIEEAIEILKEENKELLARNYNMGMYKVIKDYKGAHKNLKSTDKAWGYYLILRNQFKEK
jgi:hypothetical protein